MTRLVGAKHVFSFDLKSATDRWPLTFMFEVVQACFGREFASSAVNSTLACCVFEVPFVKKKHSQVTFTAGKPLGYLSSWPLFALSNHLLIWHCAQEAYPGRYFDRYGVLGDDVVIADTEVARLAQHYLSKLGGKIVSFSLGGFYSWL